MLPGQIDEKALEVIRIMRNAGMVINFHLVVGLATAIVLANVRTLLKENGVLYLQKIRLYKKKINDSETLDSSWFDKKI